MPKAPAPVAVVPSQDWDGNDGPWPSFIIQIGTPPQPVKVLVSTASTQTRVIAEEGCDSGDITNCKKLRGGLFNFSASSTYNQNLANPDGSYYKLGLESNLGYDGNGRFGFDNITLGFPGSGGPTLSNQTLGGVAAKSFFLGMFGLTPRPSNFTEYNDPIPSYMETLRSQKLIPGLNWAYTAGNQYRLNGVLGSLTLGGYDASRFEPGNLSIPFAAQDARDLTVKILNITSGGTQLLASPIASFLDSTIPYLYLPMSACTSFEERFGIIWNDTSQLYLINDTQHTLLQAQNPSITFTLGSLESPKTLNISFPYAAFALLASWPLTPSPTRYFPLRRAANSTQYTLGRAFYQEAYVIADYDRKTFSVAQCTWDARAKQKIVEIRAPEDNQGDRSTKLSLGAILGTVIGAVLGLGLLIGLGLCYKHRKRREVPSSEVADVVRYEKAELASHLSKGESWSNPRAVPVEVNNSQEIFEAQGSVVAVEVEALVPPFELDALDMPMELDSNNAK